MPGDKRLELQQACASRLGAKRSRRSLQTSPLSRILKMTTTTPARDRLHLLSEQPRRASAPGSVRQDFSPSPDGQALVPAAGAGWDVLRLTWQSKQLFGQEDDVGQQLSLSVRGGAPHREHRGGQVWASHHILDLLLFRHRLLPFIHPCDNLLRF